MRREHSSVIGVFDSGVGGLSVHRALVRRLPQADFVYFADQANAPYGKRETEEIIALTQNGCERLFAQGASLVVLACNTATAIALRSLQRDWLPLYRSHASRPVNVIGIVVPTVEAATQHAWRGERMLPQACEQALGIFATPATVRSGVYRTEITKRRPHMDVYEEACPELARMIETGAARPALQEAVEQHVERLAQRIGQKPWQAILGCTHYEIVGDLFARALPDAARLIHQPEAVAAALADYCARHPEYETGTSGQRRFLTSGLTEQSALVSEFWGERLAFRQTERRLR